MVDKWRALFVAAVVLCLQSPAHANEVAIAFCADAHKISISDGVDTDNASAIALSLCRGQIGLADGVDGSVCCQIVTTTSSYAECVAFAGKNPATNYGIGDTEKDAGWTATINCQADCLGYNEPGRTPDQKCATNCKVEASGCR